ncbi:hypothetical protein PFAG_03607 [Plasmodium falciparum Santa Lucia]|uniref:Transmembrane protein n=1 Tax=Plasmodium falciparum Santa Lucia TaxID=478859 RepID=W7G3M9_PLAFA|nr:hypothetical protein PFAG_05063 [Plasmodium falciparum Santa Lucia]EUT83733.1 hypothetical protein PFAG_03607 [Plasmodium falciparum Santa Lucia]
MLKIIHLNLRKNFTFLFTYSFVHIIIIIMKNSSIYIKIIIFVLKILTIEIIDNILWFNFNISYVKLFYQTSNRQ